MPIYQGTAIQNVFDLINRDNPNLPFEVSANTCFVGKPKAIAATEQGHNTEVRLVPKSASLYRGAITITYRRITLNWLFRDVKPVIERFLLGRWYSLTEFLPFINNYIGMNLSLDDINDSASLMHGSYQPQQDFTLWARVDSLMYIGSLTLTWKQGKEELGLDIMKVSELNGVLWPSEAGNDFTAWDDRKAYGTWLFWDRHFTEEVANEGWSTNLGNNYSTDFAAAKWTTAYAQAFIDQDLEINFSPYNAETNPKGVGPKLVYVGTVSLPNAGYPEINRPGFNYATIIYPVDTALYKKYGRAVMYFNK